MGRAGSGARGVRGAAPTLEPGLRARLRAIPRSCGRPPPDSCQPRMACARFAPSPTEVGDDPGNGPGLRARRPPGMTAVAHLSDPHLGATWAGGDPDRQLAAAVAAIRALGLTLDAVLVSGDLADHAADAEYARVRELVSALGAPVHVLPGNHDDRAALRR